MAWQDNCLLIESLAGTNISKNYALRWAKYTVRFHKNDGGNPEATTDQSFTYTEQKALTANAFSREDYVLSGWSTTAYRYTIQTAYRNARCSHIVLSSF